MEINDDLHVNGPPQLRQPGVLCLFVYPTLRFLNNSAIKQRRTAAEVGQHMVCENKRSSHDGVGAATIARAMQVCCHFAFCLFLLLKAKPEQNL